ncbi:ABC-2 transporter permease [Limnoglobus roseus]|uniref:ABC transporter permease n=1 Tax=Limnoglobus roseus TaxID=2598579 RepID=A0A5C1A9U0_9BACT|nr:ABC transporter permease [Limnoglobus roseus]QEL15335.1 ABC transporter permease [Limnoglobus roseus]
MDAPATAIPFRFNRFLPYWAVLQTDLGQTLRSWVYRLWLIMMALAALGYVLYKLGAANAGEYQSVAVQTDDLLRALAIGSLSLISLLAVSSISSERGTIADSILSRGISRYQYFLAKWHARVVVVLATFVTVSVAVLVAYSVLFTAATNGSGVNLTTWGGIYAVAMLAAVLMVVVSWGVAIGAMSNGTVIGITIFWIVIFGGMIALSRLPSDYPNLKWLMDGLRNVLRGGVQTGDVVQFLAASVVLAAVGAFIGLGVFARRDV